MWRLAKVPTVRTWCYRWVWVVPDDLGRGGPEMSEDDDMTVPADGPARHGPGSEAHDGVHRKPAAAAKAHAKSKKPKADAKKTGKGKTKADAKKSQKTKADAKKTVKPAKKTKGR